MNLDFAEFETVADADPGTGADVTDTGDEGAAATAVDGGAAPDAAPAAAPAFNPDAFTEQIGQTIDQRLAPIVQALTPPEPTVELDPFADDYQQRLEQLIDAKARELVAPYQQAAEYMQQQQASQWVDQHLNEAMAGYKAPDGAEGDRQAVLYAAAGFRAVTGDDARAIVAARDYMVTHDQQVAQAAVDAYKQSISGGQNGAAHNGPGVNGAAVAIEPKPGSYDEVMARYESRAAA